MPVMPDVDPLKRLREIAKLEREVEGLRPERNRLMGEAAGEGHSRQTIADAADKSKTHVKDILREVLAK